jgi:hypothetical protein
MFLAIVTAVGSVVVLVLLAIGALAVRRRLVQRPGGTFDCSLRPRPPVSTTDPMTAPSGNEPEGAVGASGSAPVPGDLADPGEEPPPAPADHGKGWIFGIARYSGDRIEWFRVFSYFPRPRYVLHRAGIEVLRRRTPRGQEELALLADTVVLVCRHEDDLLELAMSEDALTGFLAWLEAAPPGQRVNVA